MNGPLALSVVGVAAVAAGFLHAAPSDHWLPHALVASGRGWGSRVANRSFALAASFHVLTSAVVGAVFGLLGARIADAAGDSAPGILGAILAVSGILVSGLTARGTVHPHLAHPRTRFHEIEDKRLRALTPNALAAVSGLNPCLLSLPLAMAAGGVTLPAAPAAAALWSLAVSVHAAFRLRAIRRGPRRVLTSGLERGGDVFSGFVVAAAGVAILLAG